MASGPSGAISRLVGKDAGFTVSPFVAQDRQLFTDQPVAGKDEPTVSMASEKRLLCNVDAPCKTGDMYFSVTTGVEIQPGVCVNDVMWVSACFPSRYLVCDFILCVCMLVIFKTPLS